MPTRTLKYPDDVRKALQRRWASRCSLWLSGSGKWPLTLTLGRPVQSDAIGQMDAVHEWVRAWRDVSAVGEIEWCERQWPTLGRQRLPVRLILNSAEEVAHWAGEDGRWLMARKRRDRFVERWPRLCGNLLRHFDVLADYSEQDFVRLMSVLACLDEYPQSGLFPRQLPIAGLDSKWLESRKGLIAELVGALRETDAPSSDFYECCGLRPPPNLVRIALLDPAMRAQVGGLRDLTAPLEELARLALSPKCVLIVENLQTGLAFGDMESAVVIMALGYCVNVVERLLWIGQATTFYWGDIDTHGFAILSRARSYFPLIRSMMMGKSVLLRHRDLCVEEKEQHGADSLLNLTEEELDVYRNLKKQTWGFHLRLEQERIPWPEAWLAVKSAYDRGL